MAKKIFLVCIMTLININVFSLSDFTLPIYESDKNYSLKNDLGNKVIVINFWASWCHACIEEIPILNKLKSQYESKGYKFIAINAGEKDKKIRKFLKKYHFDYLILKDKNREQSKKIGIDKIPRTLILGKNGEELYNNTLPPEKFNWPFF